MNKVSVMRKFIKADNFIIPIDSIKYLRLESGFNGEYYEYCYIYFEDNSTLRVSLKAGKELEKQLLGEE